MLFMVKMKVIPPQSQSEMSEFNERKVQEKEYSQDLQRKGTWKHIWRVTGQYENYSVFDVDSNEQLHEILMNLPLLKYIEMEVEALNIHPSAI